jgi:transcriptional antiterminator RfaH
MPVLPPEPYLYPDDLLAENAGAAACSQWWVLHTRPRAEKALARRFMGRNIPFFLPLHKRPWRRRGRTLTAYVPLFPGYVFLHGAASERLVALETNLVARVLEVPDQERLQTDLGRVHRLMASGVPLTPEAVPPPGTPVRIASGPLAGMEGTVLRSGGQWRLLVEVRFLHQGVSVELEARALEALPPGRLAGAGQPG